jgi:NitT/TauT family transport system permease protein
MKRNKIFKFKWEIIPIFIFLGIWETFARLDLIPGQFFFPPFSAVITEFWFLTVSGVLGRNFLSSLTRVLIGFSAGSIVGLFIGIMMGWNALANKTLNPIISLIYPIPALGWLPLLNLSVPSSLSFIIQLPELKMWTKTTSLWPEL